MFRADLTGRRFGKLVVVRYIGASASRHSVWLCRCDCGRTSRPLQCALVSGNSTSCGCQRGVPPSPERHRRGWLWSPEYYSWCAMKTRCYNRNRAQWKDWGGRGIAVCPAWRKSFMRFLADMGKRPTPHHTLDRIDNNRGYWPSNCRWATRLQQARNSRQCKSHRLENKKEE